MRKCTTLKMFKAAKAKPYFLTGYEVCLIRNDEEQNRYWAEEHAREQADEKKRRARSRRRNRPDW